MDRWSTYAATFNVDQWICRSTIPTTFRYTAIGPRRKRRSYPSLSICLLIAPNLMLDSVRLPPYMREPTIFYLCGGGCI